MFKRFALAGPLALAMVSPMSASAQDTAAPATQDVVIETTMGNITVTLETARAPVTTGNFLRYVDEDRFDGTVFYRAMRLDWGEQPNGLIQGGTRNDPERILDPIAHEPTSETGLTHDTGTISMARFDPGTATGDFTILLAPLSSMDADPASDDPSLRAGFAAFGRVVDGMEVVRAIFSRPLDPEAGEGWMKGEMFADPVEIVDIRRVTPAKR
ncbi:peptidylprolyl isomerase [Croceicoccus hydrothermalis]|uniref:peptidylprolyl isomerase n=1 Tax=Croceicoccus hydrothermalis TaxID=2867964 RepID=UPI001EFAEE14|nr:peptidylprolyl isomerase [Croceicoccus hydrothermalis]